MGSRTEIDFSELQQVMGQFERDLSNAVRTMPILAETLHSYVLDVFEKEGAVGGAPRWPDIAASTKRRRRGTSQGGGIKILQDTGVLVGSITPASSDRYVEAYTGVRYAKYHVSKAPRRVIPLRDFFAIDEREFYAEAAEILLAAIT